MEATFTPYPQHPNERIKHSGPGIASFIIGLIGLVSLIGLLIGAAVVTVNLVSDFSAGELPSQEVLEQSGGIIVIGLLAILIIFMILIGLILGIVGLVLKNRKKAFAITGTVINGLLLIGTVFMIVLGQFAA